MSEIRCNFGFLQGRRGKENERAERVPGEPGLVREAAAERGSRTYGELGV